MGNMIRVGIADLNICKAPDVITTLGLGSCVGIALFDPMTRVSGLVHIMLPDSTEIRQNENAAKFADTGIPLLVQKMMASGASRARLVAKIAGGAQMFSFSGNSEMMQIGLRNVNATKRKLQELNIRILAEDTGLNYGRTIEFYPENGDLLIKAVGKPPKTI